jgi:hypothetical protein
MRRCSPGGSVSSRPGAPDAWTWSRPVSPGLFAPGLHPVTFFAEYDDGSGRKPSEPRFSEIEIVEVPLGEPDSFEPGDNLLATTTALLAVGGGAQFHTLHTTTDRDWMIGAMPSRAATGELARIPYSLEFTGVTLPAGASLQVEIWKEDAPIDGGVPPDCGTSDSTLCFTMTQSGAIPILSDGIAPVEPLWVRVSLRGSATANGVTPVYTIRLTRSTGARNSLVGSVGTTGTKDSDASPAVFLQISLDQVIDQLGSRSNVSYAQLEALHLYRVISPDLVNVVSQDLVAEFSPGVTAPCIDCLPADGVPPGLCLKLIDSGLDALAGLDSAFIHYEIRPVIDGLSHPGGSWCPDGLLLYRRGEQLPELPSPDCAIAPLRPGGGWLLD